MSKRKNQLQSKNEVIQENSHQWLKVASSAKDDRSFDEAMEFGKKWRKSQQ